MFVAPIPRVFVRSGKVVVTTRGTVWEIVLYAARTLEAEGPYVVRRGEGGTYLAQRATRNLAGVITSGERFVRVSTGPGKILINPASYWRYRILAEHGGTPNFPTKAIS